MFNSSQYIEQADAYLAQHGVQAAIREAVTKVLRERPAEPLVEIARLLVEKSGAAPSPLVAKPTFTNPDGRPVCIFPDAAAFNAAVCAEVVSSAAAAIAAKGSFSLMLPAGSVVKALSGLQLPEPDKVHIFFTHGSEAVANHKEVLDAFGTRLAIPVANVHDVSKAFAAEYTSLLKSHPSVSKAGGAPVLDMIVLGIGNDGHCGALHPGAAATQASGKGEVVIALSAADKAGPGVAVSMDVFKLGKKVIVACTGASKADGVAAGLGGPQGDPNCPVGYCVAPGVAWFLDGGAVSKYKPEYA